MSEEIHIRHKKNQLLLLMQRIWDYYSYPILSYPILLYATTLSSEKSTTWDEQFGIEGNEVGVGVGVRDGSTATPYRWTEQNRSTNKQ